MDVHGSTDSAIPIEDLRWERYGNERSTRKDIERWILNIINFDLWLPKNIRLHRLPGYAPELNPQEHVWDELREKEFPKRVFESMGDVVRQLAAGLPRLAHNPDALRSLTARPWFVSLNMNAH
jgi:hypothetical protein